MCEACAISRPPASNSPTEQSLRSLMLVENDERISVLPMSSVIDSSRLLNTSMAIGSARRVMRRLHQQVARAIDDDRAAWRQQRRRAHFVDDGGAGEARADGEPAAVEYRRLDPAGVEVDLAASVRVRRTLGRDEVRPGRSIRPIAFSRQFTTSIARPGTS